MTASEDIDNLVIVPPEKPLKMRAQPIMPPRVKRMWQKLWLKPREERREADRGRNGAGARDHAGSGAGDGRNRPALRPWYGAEYAMLVHRRRRLLSTLVIVTVALGLLKWAAAMPSDITVWTRAAVIVLFVLTIGAILCILAIPSGKQTGKMQSLSSGDDEKSLFLKSDSSATSEDDLTVSSVSSGSVARTYEQQLETRVKNILKNVDGVGKVDVMIALYSSSEKVIRSDTNSSGALTEETDSTGGTRRSESSAYSTTTVMEDSNGNSTPVIEKEVYPEISGIVISAEGGDDPKVRSEISTAMEALFGLPAHKIKVLKRAG